MIPDNPIRNESEDLLKRAPLAALLAGEVRSVDASQGCVVGIFGPWGSGKTSLVNLIKGELGREPALEVFDFNPWMFSGVDQLLEAFFREIGAQFRSRGDRLADLAAGIDAYAEIISPLRIVPLVGPWFERVKAVTGTVARWRDQRKGGALDQRDRLARSLAALEKPLVIVLDDIDRLRTDEIREIFKLVRLVANFPNVIYLLAFDRHRVEAALTEDGLPGRDYLEKIVQVPYDIPNIPDEVVLSTLTGALDESLERLPHPGEVDPSAWPDVLFEIVKPLVRSLRDVRRYVASVQGTIQGLEGRVALVDVLGMEAVRIFSPDVFAQVQRAQRVLTSTSSLGSQDLSIAQDKLVIERLVAAAGDDRDVAIAMIRRLFPVALRHLENSHYDSGWQAQWLRRRRIAHLEVLRFYLERVASSHLTAFELAETAFRLLGREPELTDFLSGLDGSQLADTIQALEVFEDEFQPETVPSAAAALLNQTVRLSPRPAGLFGLRAEMIVARVVLRLLRRLEAPAEVETAVPLILESTVRLSDQFELLKIVGSRQGVGQSLIGPAAEAQFESDLRGRVAGTSASQLAAEHDLLLLLYWIGRPSNASPQPVTVPADPRVYAQLMRLALAETRMQSMGNRLVSRRTELHWDVLIEVAGGEERLREMLPEVEDLGLDDHEVVMAIALVHQYLSGWRPPVL